MKKSRGQVCQFECACNKLLWQVSHRARAESTARVSRGRAQGTLENQQHRQVPSHQLLVTKRVQLGEIYKLYPVLLWDVTKTAYPTSIKHHKFGENTEQVTSTYKKGTVTSSRRRKRGFAPPLPPPRRTTDLTILWVIHSNFTFAGQKALFSDLLFITFCLCRLSNHT